MSKRLLLVSGNSETVPAPVYPLALPHLAGAAKQAGHSAVQYDVLAQGRALLPQILQEFKPHLIGISIRNIDNVDALDSRSYIGEYQTLVDEIRRHVSAPIVLGGSGFSLFPKALLKIIGADYGVVGPGEKALCGLLDALPDKLSDGNIPGLITASSSEAPANVFERPFTAMAHDSAILEYYWSMGGMIGIQTKRGCPKTCSYCTYPLIDGHVVQYIDPAHVVDEMERLMLDWGIHYFFVVDSIFNLIPERETAFAEEICRRSLSLSWGAFFAPTPIDRTYLSALKRSGLTHVEFGSDSLCDTMLDSYRKDFSVADVLQASSLCAEMGLFCAHYLVFGGQGETSDTIRQTIANAHHIRHSVFFPFVGVRIYPGTTLYSVAVRDGVLQLKNDCLEPIFYFSNGLDGQQIWELIGGAVGEARRWILPSRYKELAAITQRLRQRGAKGPLWEHLRG